MLAARAQLDFINSLVARFQRRDSVMQPLIVFQSQYIAIIALLRSVGHVFEKVDCDTSEREVWGNRKWAEWKRVPIFRSFIEPRRNDLLKEFKGGLEFRDSGFSTPAIVADPSMPGMTSIVTTLEAAELRDANGRLILPQVHEAVAFWDRCLAEAEAAFGEDRRSAS
ncbi:hypothetical protein EET67_16350 [Pseudaminobacter arsenicus]|uniref:Uncharacterized protein n=1 Tax=Borborobacter arsenicus TaxID=1851146 RepID=A0A432V3T1_9HYPH|nr:hypothetical protein [Pseudaminobacter arsenicus]RUM96799.1 hypothetical protein EET67_16350 [Pseudaminobacter arsenicus]